MTLPKHRPHHKELNHQNKDNRPANSAQPDVLSSLIQPALTRFLPRAGTRTSGPSVHETINN